MEQVLDPGVLSAPPSSPPSRVSLHSERITPTTSPPSSPSIQPSPSPSKCPSLRESTQLRTPSDISIEEISGPSEHSPLSASSQVQISSVLLQGVGGTENITTSQEKEEITVPSPQQDDHQDTCSEPLGQHNGAEPEETDNEAVVKLKKLIGLGDVKAHFQDVQRLVHICKRQGRNPRRRRLHAVFQGNPGTGKTTVARLYGKFLHSIGVLRSRLFREVSGGELASRGPTALRELYDPYTSYNHEPDSDVNSDAGSDPGTSQRVKPHGVLFVDEAYQLTAPHASNAGRQVLDIILAEMERNIGKWVVIFAGYKTDLESFFAHNKGLESRVPYTIDFADFSEDELLQILERLIDKEYGGKMEVEGGMGGEYMRVAIRRLARRRGHTGFGNARSVENLFSQIDQRQRRRLCQDEYRQQPDPLYLSKEDLIGPNPSDVRSRSQAWKDLQQLVGIDAVKKSVEIMFDTLGENYKREMNGKAPFNFPLNRVFAGSPGTGKTTVAKLYG